MKCVSSTTHISHNHFSYCAQAGSVRMHSIPSVESLFMREEMCQLGGADEKKVINECS